MRVALAVLMLLHGIAHLPGFLAVWQPGGFGEMPYKTTILAGRVDLGYVGVRVLGVVWLLVALGFVVTAAGTFTGRSWWTVALVGVALTSLVLSALEWPLARVGVGVNVAILAALFAGQRFGWLPPATQVDAQAANREEIESRPRNLRPACIVTTHRHLEGQSSTPSSSSSSSASSSSSCSISTTPPSEARISTSRRPADVSTSTS